MSGNEVKNQGTAEVQSMHCDVTKIKREKIDREIEEKINASRQNEVENVKPLTGTNGLNVVTTTATNDSSDSRQSSEDNEANDDDCNGTEDAELDVKKTIEPIKSSNEILAELFKVFNASPPEELLNDENLLRKSKRKKHKKEKKKKKKKSKDSEKIKLEKNEAPESDSSAASASSKHGESKNKHRKHKKHKHKEEKSDSKREKSKEKQKSQKSKEKSKDQKDVKMKDLNKTSTTDKEQKSELRSELKITKTYKRAADEKPRDVTASKIRRKSDERNHRVVAKNHNSFYNGFRQSEHSHDRSPSHSRHSNEVRIKKEHINRTEKRESQNDGQISEISLSDEETYLNERTKHQDTGTQRSATGAYLSTRHENRYNKHNSFYAGASDHVSSRNRDRDRTNYHYNRQRTRSRSRSRDLGIDKKRLLEIARKNAISMFKRGSLPGCAEMSEEIKDKVLLKMRYGGRTVQDLTEFCKKLSNGENLNDISDLSSEEDSDVDKGGNAKAFNHPFVIKEREPIVMRIRGSAPLPPKKPQDEHTKAITQQFPVSSGQHHRMTEAWVPVVEPKPPLPALPPLATIVPQSASIFKTAKNIFEKSIPVQAEQQPAFKTTNASSAAVTESGGATETTVASSICIPDHNSTTVATQLTTTAPIATPLPIAAPPSMAAGPPLECPSTAPAPVAPPTAICDPKPFVADVPVPSAVDSVFPQPQTSLDVSSIISKRLNAMRRLQENPLDAEAIKMMYCTQKDMTSWVSSKHMPGQFTGSTGAHMLTARELSSGPQAWARRDQLTSTVPVTGGMGMTLLKKMGWKPGEGLGREKTGSLQPLLLDVKLDKRGLVSEEDNGYQQRQPQVKKRRAGPNVVEAQQNLQNKHPVSLLNELTSKRKWTPPLYTLVNEGGPSHNKVFLFSVSINGQTFTPPQGSNTKKDAKVKAARHCLEQIGIIPQ